MIAAVALLAEVVLRRSGRLPRRTPMRRGEPLARRSLLRRPRLVERVSPGYVRAKAAWQVARFAAFRRAGGWCEICGTSIWREAYEVHHRRLRSQGGTDGLANLLALCPGPGGCHRRVHDNPEWGYANGWLVHSWADPAAVPVLIASQRAEVLLLPDGGYGRCVA